MISGLNHTSMHIIDRNRESTFLEHRNIVRCITDGDDLRRIDTSLLES